MNSPEPKPFDQVLCDLSEGSTVDQLTYSLSELIAAVQETGRTGTLTLTLRAEFDGAGRVQITDKVSSKVPEHDRPSTQFFVTKAGGLSRRDPNQPEIPGVVHAEFGGQP